MIITLRQGAPEEVVGRLAAWFSDRDLSFRLVQSGVQRHLVTPAGWRSDEAFTALFGGIVERMTDTRTEYQLCTRAFQPQNTVIDLGDGVVFGTDRTVVMAGPCAIESEAQVMRAAEFLSERLGVKVFRAGAFKPRTSPYAFQGMEREGLKLLDRVRRTFGMKIVTEVKDETHLAAVADHADIIQIGTKSMYHFTLLAGCGAVGRPILLKRAFMATLKEFLQAADFIMANGNPRVILCERGIRTFEPQTRFSLDVCAAALLKDISHLPLVLDPSHAVGLAPQVPLVAQAAAALEADGLLIEVHPDPPAAKCDREQALSLERFEALMPRLAAVCSAVGRRLV